METKIIEVLITVTIVVAGIVVHTLTLKKKLSKKDVLEKVEYLKEPLLMAFLCAEKNNIAGPEKMQWCIEQVVRAFKLDGKISEEEIKIYAQHLYNTSSSYIKEELAK